MSKVFSQKPKSTKYPLSKYKPFLFLCVCVLICCPLWGQAEEAGARLDSLTAQTKSILSSDPQQAYLLAQECERLAQEEQDTLALAYSYKHQGLAYFFQEVYAPVISFHEQAMPLFEAAGDKDGVWACHNNIAIGYNEMGEQNLAMQSHVRALETARAHELRPRIATSLANMGNVMSDLKDYTAALRSFYEALEIHREVGNDFGVTQCLTGIAGVHTSLQQSDSCLYYNRLALPLIKARGPSRELMACYSNMASSFGILSQFDSANVYLGLAGQYLDGVSFRNKIQWHSTKGLILNLEGRFRQADLAYKTGIDLALENDLTVQANWIRLYMARNFQDMGEYQAAFDSLYAFANEDARMTQLSSEAYMANLNSRFQAQHERDSLEQLQALTALEAKANAADLKASRFKYGAGLILAGVLLIGMLAVLLFVRYRNQQKRIQEEAKRLALEHRLLRSSMAPHFLFNSMNAIQQYIGQNDTFQAEVYLAKFARLMRTNLNHTRLERVSLAEELEALENYIQLEQFRFEGKFTYALEQEAEVEVDMITIPPMMIQPHVENAILHGLRPLSGGGKLTIKLVERPDRLTVCIEDNGVGRGAAETTRNQTVPAHRSMAMEITNERLVGLNLDLGREGYRQEIEDLFHPDGKPAGTRITLHYPI